MFPDSEEVVAARPLSLSMSFFLSPLSLYLCVERPTTCQRPGPWRGEGIRRREIRGQRQRSRCNTLKARHLDPVNPGKGEEKDGLAGAIFQAGRAAQRGPFTWPFQGSKGQLFRRLCGDFPASSSPL